MADVTVDEVREQLRALGYNGDVPDSVLQSFLDDIRKQSESALDMIEGDVGKPEPVEQPAQESDDLRTSSTPGRPTSGSTVSPGLSSGGPQLRSGAVRVPKSGATPRRARAGASRTPPATAPSVSAVSELELGMDVGVGMTPDRSRKENAGPQSAEVVRPQTAPVLGMKHSRTPDEGKRARPRRHECHCDDEHTSATSGRATLGTTGVPLGSPGFIKARSTSAAHGAVRGGPKKHDPVAKFARMQALWSSDRRKARRSSKPRVSTALSQGARPRTAARRSVTSAYVPPDQKRRDRLRLEVRAKMLSYAAKDSAVTHRGRMLMPSDYVGPGGNARKSVRWATRARLMSGAT